MEIRQFPYALRPGLPQGKQCFVFQVTFVAEAPPQLQGSFERGAVRLGGSHWGDNFGLQRLRQTRVGSVPAGLSGWLSHVDTLVATGVL